MPDDMRAEEKMKTQLSIKIATRSRRLGEAAGPVCEWLDGERWRLFGGALKGLTTSTETNDSPCHAEREDGNAWKYVRRKAGDEGGAESAPMRLIANARERNTSGLGLG
jgi:hypothetical protein